MKRQYVFITIVCVLLSVFLRLYNIQAPIADWHSWRQSDTAAVARNFIHGGIDLLHPRYDDLSNIQSGKDNPEGWRMVEMPLYQATAVLIQKIIPGVSIEIILRFVSIISVALSIVCIGILFKTFIDNKTAYIGMGVYAILPFSIYYGRTILPDSFAVFLALFSLVCLLQTQSRKWLVWVILAGISAAMSVLVRPMAVFLLVPSIYLLSLHGTTRQKIISLVLYGVIMSLPLLWWRHWILQYPEGIAVSDWLYNKAGIRFKGAWFYWLFAKRLGELILGYWGLIPFGIGLISAQNKKDTYVSVLWLTGGLSYLTIFAGGNVQHDYYQALLIPVFVWFVAKGIAFLIRPIDGIHRFGAISICVISMSFCFAFSWYTIRTYFWINHPEIVEAGKEADLLLPKNAKVIAPYNGDTTFLYQINRKGWPLGFDIDKKIAMGATHYVTISPTDADLETRDLAQKYMVLVRNNSYAIIDLTKINPSFTSKSILK